MSTKYNQNKKNEFVSYSRLPDLGKQASYIVLGDQGTNQNQEFFHIN